MSSALSHDESSSAHRARLDSVDLRWSPTASHSPKKILPPPPAPAAHLQTLVDQYLADQRNLSAVDQFSRWHDRSNPISHRPALESHYRKLLPIRRRSSTTSPATDAIPAPAFTPASWLAPGEQLAFEVNLDACSGCKACVTACHSLNGLEEGESWRSVGLLLDRSRTPSDAPPIAIQHVTTACHHCVDPACLNGCPVLAYEKDAITGIVRHLDDQCIGCSYCTMMCPYEVPRYSARLGIVRKCDLCHDRLADGEAPACVQGCPNEAIRVTVVDTAEVTASHRPLPDASPQRSQFLADAPDPSITIPTTRYVSASGRAESLVAADRNHAAPAPAHTPLAFFLVLSQASVGIATVASVTAAFGGDRSGFGWMAAWVMQSLALIIASAHLGQPTRAWRAFLGWRKSWFSREVIAFGAYTAAISIPAAASAGFPVSPRLQSMTTAIAPCLGVIAVATSAMIYVATRRAFWSAGATFTRFVGTLVLLGGAFMASPGAALALTVLGLAVKLGAEGVPRTRRQEFDAGSEWGRTRALLSGPLRPIARIRLILAALGAALLALRLVAPSFSAPLAVVAGCLLLAGEVLERHLFFVAVAPQRMPGALPT